MNRLLGIMESPFMKIKGSVIYLIDKSVSYEAVNSFFEMKDLKQWVVYQGDLSMKFILDIISGVGRSASEGQNEIITYRIRAEDYIKQQNQLRYESDSAKYLTDEDFLSDVPAVEEPEPITPAEDTETTINYVVGADRIERPLMVFFLAQYISMSSKVLIMERDTEYHMLTELVTKSGIECDIIYIDEFIDDIGGALTLVRASLKNLIVIGCKNRRKYDYNFYMDLIYSNLKGEIPNMIRECSFDEIPYGKLYTIVMQNTIPDILECCNEIKDYIDDNVTFVGMQVSNLGPVNLSSSEMKSVIEVILSNNAIAVQVVHINGILLKGEEVVYDILSILNRGNRG